MISFITHNPHSSSILPSFFYNIHLLSKPIFISYSYKFIQYFFTQIIKNELSLLIYQIKSINKMFILNTCSRFMNEFNILIHNSFDFDTTFQNQQCLITSIIQFLNKPDTQNMFNDIIFKNFQDNNYYHLINQNYKQILRQILKIGPSLQEIILFTQDNFSYTQKLRGFHPHKHNLIDIYQTKIEYFNDIINKSIQKDAIELFSIKINDLVLNPQISMCNVIISKTNINIMNFKENFVTLFSISIKDWTNNLLHPTDGIIAVHTQNLLTKSFYVLTYTVLFLLFTVFYNKLNQLFKKNK